MLHRIEVIHYFETGFSPHVIDTAKIREEIESILRLLSEESKNFQEMLSFHPYSIVIPKTHYFLYCLRKLIFYLFNKALYIRHFSHPVKILYLSFFAVPL